nr:uncharacterized protein CFP56_70475 [Quercus suber]
MLRRFCFLTLACSIPFSFLNEKEVCFPLVTLSLEGLGFLFIRGVERQFNVGMEELTRRCDNLSLSVREDKKVTLSKKRHVLEFVLAAKFYMKRALSMDAMVDAEKVLLREPWSYDRHMLIIQRFNGSRPLKEVEFKHCSFWVQIHDIPFKFMTLEIALEIGETVGSVMVPQDWSEMKRGTLMRIQVKIDVTRALYDGRRVAFEDGLEGWIAFQYKRLPNMCF